MLYLKRIRIRGKSNSVSGSLILFYYAAAHEVPLLRSKTLALFLRFLLQGTPHVCMHYHCKQLIDIYLALTNKGLHKLKFT